MGKETHHPHPGARTGSVSCGFGTAPRAGAGQGLGSRRGGPRGLKGPWELGKALEPSHALPPTKPSSHLPGPGAGWREGYGAVCLLVPSSVLSVTQSAEETRLNEGISCAGCWQRAAHSHANAPTWCLLYFARPAHQDGVFDLIPHFLTRLGPCQTRTTDRAFATQ